MANNIIAFSKRDVAPPDFHGAEELFADLLRSDSLEGQLSKHPERAREIDSAIESATNIGLKNAHGDRAHALLFLHRILYRINRLSFFWLDHLSNYNNERSPYLSIIRKRIEDDWLEWEIKQIDLELLRKSNAETTLKSWAAADRNVANTDAINYLLKTKAEYIKLIAIIWLEEFSQRNQLSRLLGGAANQTQSYLLKAFLKSVAPTNANNLDLMIDELGLSKKGETFIESIPWEILAKINLSYVHSERKRFYLRFIGDLTCSTILRPMELKEYADTARLLGLPAAEQYWSNRAQDERLLCQTVVEQAAVSLFKLYPNDSWEVLLGYQLQKRFRARANDALRRELSKENANPQTNQEEYESLLQEEAAFDEKF